MSAFEIWVINAMVTLYQHTGINIAPSDFPLIVGAVVAVVAIAVME